MLSTHWPGLQVGSVSVPKLMELHTYAKVHTLVSTITGTVGTHVSPIQCIATAFPGGSMTGAPKKRSIEILDRCDSHQYAA